MLPERRRLNRQLWVLIAAMLLSIGIALTGVAIVHRNTPLATPASNQPTALD